MSDKYLACFQLASLGNFCKSPPDGGPRQNRRTWMFFLNLRTAVGSDSHHEYLQHVWKWYCRLEITTSRDIFVTFRRKSSWCWDWKSSWCWVWKSSWCCDWKSLQRSRRSRIAVHLHNVASFRHINKLQKKKISGTICLENNSEDWTK